MLAWDDASAGFCTIGVTGASQLCTSLSKDCKSEKLITEWVQRDEGEFPCNLQNAGDCAKLDASDSGSMPEMYPEAKSDVETKQRLAEQKRHEGNAMFRANDFMNAIVYYTESLALDPTSGAAMANRSQCWLKLGDHEKALADATKCTELDPMNAKGWFRRGMSLHALQQHAEAIPALLEAEKLEPGNNQIPEAIRMSQLMARKHAGGA